ncbi:hypothetical protein [Bremerella sp. P1]|uniref:hypothetical protein n=1 Tax=Bremerella sp. P1 TaxID=3026424 RepID=UPI0023676C80|nr:hypothetical protein [Bremerella sp. P1]WDI43791.1 hypothetical protein PSR63_07500 [Bremerella sp. P1]
MNVKTISLPVVLGTLLFCTSSVFADCGQILVTTRVHVHVGVSVRATTYYPPPTVVIRRPVPPPLVVNQTQTQSQSQTVAAGGGIPAYRGDDPEWNSIAAAKAVGKGIRTFKEPRQFAVIAWNGEEEILTLSTEQQAFKGEGAALSVLPLPGKPIEIKEGDRELFANCSALLAKKLVGSAKKPVIAEAKIGAHNIFVIEADSTDQFVTEVEAYVNKKFGEDAQPLITGHIRELIDRYQKLGFRHFAFDLVLNRTELDVKQAIQYRFVSDYVYYPLYISRAGGTGATTVEAIVFTPGGLTQVRKGALPADAIVNTSSVQFTQAELAEQNKDLGEFFGAKGALGRKWTISGDLSSFTGDVMMRP